MNSALILQDVVYVVALLAIGYPLGCYIYKIYNGERVALMRIFAPLEQLLYRVMGVDEEQQMHAKKYASSVLWFSLFNARLHICFRKAVQCLRIRRLIKIQTLITICQHHHLTIRRKQQLDDDMGNKGELLCIIDMHILIPGGKGLQNGRCTH